MCVRVCVCVYINYVYIKFIKDGIQRCVLAFSPNMHMIYHMYYVFFKQGK